jgi:hypothetical protein
VPLHAHQTMKTTNLRIPYCVALVISAIGLAACSTAPESPPATAVVSTTPPLEQWMTEASRARQEGARGVERDTYRKAAQAYPTSKEPWLKLAESYFEVQDYGNSILAAQEVLQRDASDKVANSLLAVSGLRVSSGALSALRLRQDLSADTRDQAQEVVKTLREVLGEPVLVPKPADATAPSAQPVRPRPRPRPVAPTAASAPKATPAPATNTAPTATGLTTTVPTARPPATPAAAAPKPAKPANPFDTLK